VSDDGDRDQEHRRWRPDSVVSSSGAEKPTSPWRTTLPPVARPAAPPQAAAPAPEHVPIPEPVTPPDPDPVSPPPAAPPAPQQAGGTAYWPADPFPVRAQEPGDVFLDQLPAGPSRRSGVLIGLLIGLVLAAATGTGGYLLGNRRDHPTPVPQPTPSLSLHVYEANQLALNQTKLAGVFAPLAQPLLPWVGGCTADTDLGGMKLPTDETSHIYCRYGGTTVHFSLYRSPAALESERAYREQLVASARQLLPGVAQPRRKKGGVSGVEGNYVEYAWKADDGRTWCGIWWDRDDVPQAGMRLEALCGDEGLGGSWEPLRDLWQRSS
jgi:hypothetical protein